jgi:gliding motility-associated-like protein
LLYTRCVAEDDAAIFVKRNIYFPNAFSPNDDGINDRFIVFTEKKAKIALFQIFNRWGDLVYQTEKQCFTNDYDCAWDGTYRGFSQKVGLFTYRVLIDFGDGNLEEYKGDLQLF